jgi:LysM repeat protein
MDLNDPPLRGIQHISFMRAFMVVLVLHVILGGGIYGYCSIRKMIASDRLALTARTPAYAGVPEASAKPLNEAPAAPSSQSIAPNSQSPTQEKAKVVATAQTSKAQSAPRVHEQKKNVVARHSLQPTPEIRALFSHSHSSSSDKNNAVTETPSTPAAALKEVPHRDLPYATPATLVATPHPSPAPPSEYTVGPGDTLSRVASMMGVPASEIRKANGLDSGNNLQVGQTLKIPTPAEDHALELVQKPIDPVVTPERPERFVSKMDQIAPNGVYVVQHGDNPYMVARKLGVSFTDLMLANSINNPATITVGQLLKVPGKSLASN